MIFRNVVTSWKQLLVHTPYVTSASTLILNLNRMSHVMANANYYPDPGTAVSLPFRGTGMTNGCHCDNHVSSHMSHMHTAVKVTITITTLSQAHEHQSKTFASVIRNLYQCSTYCLVPTDGAKRGKHALTYWMFCALSDFVEPFFKMTVTKPAAISSP